MEGANDNVENDGVVDVSSCNCFHDIKFQHLNFQSCFSSPFLQEFDVEEDDPLYAASFNAAHQINHINVILEQYNHTVSILLDAFVADNTGTNRKMAKDAGLPHLPYLNHTHALDVGELEKTGAAISTNC